MQYKQMEEWGDADSMRVNTFPRDDQAQDGETIRSNALSGGERNRLFIQSDGNFKDVSLVSGIDFREDGRGFVLFDFDRDGWLDVGVTSPNAPRFRIGRNRMSELQKKPNSFVELQLVGGHRSRLESSEWSPRDAFGARVKASIGDEERMFQLTCGEGLSSQNAKRIHIGMGQKAKIDKLEVFWPSGKRTTVEDIPAGEKRKIFENPAMEVSRK